MERENKPLIVVVAPDSFKGSLTPREAAEAIAYGVLCASPSAVVHRFPMADGGEGTLDALLARSGKRLSVVVRNAAGDSGPTTTGLLPDGSGVIEIANIVGITDAAGMAVPVERRTTLGVGDAIKSMLDQGVERIHVALGGSSTNDGGAGLLTALGMRMYDDQGSLVEPVPEKLGQVARIDVSEMDRRLEGCELSVLSDVDNPLNGERGATAVFGPQKGVALDEIKHLDASLVHYAEHVEQALHRQVRDDPGSGAAGGLGFALGILGAQMCSGAEFVADTLGVNTTLAGAHWAITGEGRSDTQTLHGKAPFVVSRRARQHGVATTLLSGAVDAKSLQALGRHFYGCFSITPGPVDLESAIKNAGSLLSDAAEQVARVWIAAGNRQKTVDRA